MRSIGSRSLVLFFLFVFVGCATPPKLHTFEDSAVFSAPYDDVWSAVIETFADLNLPIDNMEKASGLITTDWISFTGTGKDYCDCGGAGISTVLSTEGRFNVFVRDEESSVRVKVNTTYRETRVFGDARSTVDCTSTGGLEARIHAEVGAKL